MNYKIVKPLKTKKLTSSTPAHHVAKSMRGGNLGKLEQPTFAVSETLSDSFEILPPADLKPIPKAKKPTALSSICEAIQKTGVPKKGASYINIRKWIIDNREYAKTGNSLTALLKRAIDHGLKSGVLSRPKRCKDNVGLQGSFVLAQTNLPDKERPKVAPAIKGSKSSVQKTRTAKGGAAKGGAAKGGAAKGGAAKGGAAKGGAAKGGAAKGGAAKGGAAKGGSASDTEVRIHVANQVPKRLNLSDTTIMEAKRTKLKSAVSKPKVDTKIAPKRTSVGKAVSVSKTKERLNGIKKPKRVLSKAPKAKPVAKTVNSEVQAKETKTKKLYTSNVKPVAKNFSRKDLSDTELEVKPAGRKSMKSYSSDTDINMIGLKKDPNQIKPKRKGKL